MSVPTVEPTRMAAGYSLIWNKTLTDYPAGDGWELNYVLTPPSGAAVAVDFGTEITADGDGFNVNVLPNSTTTITTQGWGRLSGSVTLSGDSVAIYDAPILIAVVGQLSTAQQMLAAVDAMMLGNASREEQELEMSGGGIAKRLALCTKDELLRLREYWLRKVNEEIAAAQVAAGAGSGRLIRNQYRRPR